MCVRLKGTIRPFEVTYYLGADKGGEKAYRLLVETMADTGLAVVIQFVWRDRENIVAMRAPISAPTRKRGKRGAA